MNLRPATNADSSALVELIDGVYREYGDQIFLQGFDQDLLDIEGNYLDRGGSFVVMEDHAGRIAGSHAAMPLDEARGICTFRRLYLAPEHRGTGIGAQLMDWALFWARDRGYKRVEFWSDVRFERAHKFFESYGFVRGEVRHLNDGWMPYSEYFYRLELGG